MAGAAVTGQPHRDLARLRVGQPVIEEVGPVIEHGRWPAKAVVGECLPVTATIWREGQHRLAATVTLRGPDGAYAEAAMSPLGRGLDRWQALVVADRPGRWEFQIEAWTDPWADWLTLLDRAVTATVPGAVAPAGYLPLGARLVHRAAGAIRDRAAGAGGPELAALADLLLDEAVPVTERLAMARSEKLHALMLAAGLRDGVLRSPAHPLRVDRRRASVGCWYTQFPRSTGGLDAAGRPVHGSFASATADLDRIAALGVDVLYLPPIHPIGSTGRKGPGGQPAERTDPGSPWAIGSPAGGHEAVHPELGSLADFQAYRQAAAERGIELALDLALHCSPDHPWVSEHPDWFVPLGDGSMLRAGTPPREWADIYELNFAGGGEPLYRALLGTVLLWAERGVRIFRVDNPHSKPPALWQRLIEDATAACPDLVFLGEAFTGPAQQRGLSKLGFSQSYTYFIWRQGKAELEAFGRDLVASADFLRPNLFPTTHDILPRQLQGGGPQIFAIRAALAALLSPSWGIYAGYEHCANLPAGDGEEYAGSEKFQLGRPVLPQPGAPSVATWIAELNRLRRARPAWQELRSLRFHPAGHEQVIALSKQAPGTGEMVAAVLTLDPERPVTAVVRFDAALLPADCDPDHAALVDELTGERLPFGGEHTVRLDPHVGVARIFRLVC
ncbi:MAG TPA: maltotransferase domain-containing protein [Jatrophihabitans sp.]|nr:maltotransferase domain-containing protein [Jatrophihabitans sp.]